MGRLPAVLPDDALPADAPGPPRPRLPAVAAGPDRRHRAGPDAPPLRRHQAARGAACSSTSTCTTRCSRATPSRSTGAVREQLQRRRLQQRAGRRRGAGDGQAGRQAGVAAAGHALGRLPRRRAATPTTTGPPRRRFVDAALDGADGNDLVLDLGANDGVYSRQAADQAGYVVAVEADPAVVDTALPRSCAAEGEKRILPIVMDLADPSPGGGWARRRAGGVRRPGPAGPTSRWPWRWCTTWRSAATCRCRPGRRLAGRSWAGSWSSSSCTPTTRWRSGCWPTSRTGCSPTTTSTTFGRLLGGAVRPSRGGRTLPGGTRTLIRRASGVTDDPSGRERARPGDGRAPSSRRPGDPRPVRAGDRPAAAGRHREEPRLLPVLRRRAADILARRAVIVLVPPLVLWGIGALTGLVGPRARRDRPRRHVGAAGRRARRADRQAARCRMRGLPLAADRGRGRRRRRVRVLALAGAGPAAAVAAVGPVVFVALFALASPASAVVLPSDALKARAGVARAPGPATRRS